MGSPHLNVFCYSRDKAVFSRAGLNFYRGVPNEVLITTNKHKQAISDNDAADPQLLKTHFRFRRFIIGTMCC